MLKKVFFTILQQMIEVAKEIESMGNLKGTFFLEIIRRKRASRWVKRVFTKHVIFQTLLAF